MIWRLLIVIVILAAVVGIVVERTFTQTQIRSIAEVRSASDVRGGTVAIKGRIIYAKDNRFVLDDGTGTAELSTCPLWYKRIDLHEGDTVMVIGQLMTNPSLVTKSDFILSVYKIFRGGEVIMVRRRPGKPPWTTYRAPETQLPSY